jgi:propanediol dehydratase small subunit
MLIDAPGSKTGKPPSELSLDAILAGKLSMADLSIGPLTLRSLADAVEADGNIVYANNLRRAAELTSMSNEEVMEIYRALRPGRATGAELLAIAHRLENEVGAPLTARLVREAAEVYRERGLVE